MDVKTQAFMTQYQQQHDTQIPGPAHSVQELDYGTEL